MNVHKLEGKGPYITSCGFRCTPYDRTQYMDMFGDIIRANKAWEGVTCRQCLKENVNSALTPASPSA